MAIQTALVAISLSLVAIRSPLLAIYTSLVAIPPIRLKKKGIFKWLTQTVTKT